MPMIKNGMLTLPSNEVVTSTLTLLKSYWLWLVIASLVYIGLLVLVYFWPKKQEQPITEI